MRKTILPLTLLALTLCPGLHSTPLVTVFATGFVLPESISLAPASFGLAPGTLVVTDAGNLASSTPNSMLYAVPAGGGTPTPIGGGFSNNGGSFGGMFAPAGFGSLAGNYLAFGWTGSPAGAYSLSSSSGTLTPFYNDPTPSSYSLDNPSLAPSGFGSAAGDILVPEALFNSTTAGVFALSPSGSVTTFATISNFGSVGGVTGGFGSTFAPSGFVAGATGSVLLVSDVATGAIDWIDSSGGVHVFTTVPLFSGQSGLRQMAFAPAGFGSYGGDLFVSVSGSTSGGGTFGSVDVIDATGALVGIISQGTVGAPFDPRGLYFASNTQLLIADSDPSIYSAPPGAVSATPEPAYWPALLVLGCLSSRRRLARLAIYLL
jgi:hypothetical protein